eukprot:8160912-Alexandrium_andersonii.AAC.1
MGSAPPPAVQVRRRQLCGPGVPPGTGFAPPGTGGRAAPPPQGQARAPPSRVGGHRLDVPRPGQVAAPGHGCRVR